MYVEFLPQNVEVKNGIPWQMVTYDLKVKLFKELEKLHHKLNKFI